MRLRQAVLLTPPKSSHSSPLLSRQQSAPVSPLAATLMELPASVANKGLTVRLNPLDATLTKNREAGVFFPFWHALRAVERSTIEEGGDGDRSQGCTGPRGRTLREDQARSVLQAGVTSE